MCGRFYLDTMHADRANLIMRYLLIRWSDSESGNSVATVKISRSFLWYAMNELIHTIQEQIDACDARTKWYMWCENDFFFWVQGWSLQSSSLIKSWVQNWVSTCVCVCVHVRVPAGDCALCMMNSYGYMSHPLWPWVLLTLWHEYVLEAIAVGAYLCHTVCIVTVVWLSWFMSPSEVGFPVYVSRTLRGSGSS